MDIVSKLKRTLFLWRRRKANRRAVQELSRSLALIVDVEALAASVAARIQELFDCERLVLLQLDRQSGRLLPGFCTGMDMRLLEGVSLELQGPLARWFLINETSLDLTEDRGVFEYLSPHEQGLLERLGVRVCAPLLAINHLTGIIMLGSDREGWVLSRGDRELLQHITDQASLAFQNAALYREQQDRLDRLHRAERLSAVGQLAAGVAHEIRNPLTAIRSTMQYLLKSLEAEDPRHELVEELVDEVDRINGTISGLLSLTRSGEFEPVETDPVAPLLQAVRLVEAQARAQGVELVRPEEEGELRVFGDAQQLRRLFLNLLLNALQAMPEGGRIALTVGVVADDATDQRAFTDAAWSARRWVRIQVADDGPGIPKEQLRKVFDPLYTTKREGTGLGLAICHGIVERHEGEIELESEVDHGTTVCVRLPLLTGLGGASPEP